MQAEKHNRNVYLRLGVMIGLSFLIMFAFMYAMVDRWANVYPNLNQGYMAGLMAAPMAILELMLMGAMYPDKRLNGIIITASAALLVLCWLGIREQVAITDKSFLRSMISHHAGAILMCGKAPVTDGEIRRLCTDIIQSQQREIDQMTQILARLERRG